MKWNKERKWLAAFLLVIFLLSAGYSFYYKINPVVDAKAYDRIALNILDGQGFREDAAKSYEFDGAILRAGPAYEFFLAGIYFVFGHYYEAVWLIQAFLHAVSAYLIFLIARMVFEKQTSKNAIAFVALGLFGLHPDLIEISAMLMTETLYLFFTIATLYVFVKIFSRPERKIAAALLGFLTGLAILTRPPILLFVPVFLFFYAIRKYYAQLFLFFCFFVIVLIPWALRNHAIYGDFIPTTLIGEYNLWIGNIESANGGQIAGGYNPLTEYLNEEGSFDLKEKARQEFLRVLKEDPSHFIKLSFLRFLRYFSLIRPMGFWFYQNGIGQIAFVLSSLIGIGILFVSGFSGMLLSKKEKSTILYYCIALGLSAPILLLPSVVESRYRLQIYPFLALFGSYFLVLLYERKKEALKALYRVFSLLLIISVLDFIFFWPAVHEHLYRLFS
ncbi:MAG: glycosyltransferase family 39 protein [Candidatus Magasanikbacteria bacterium]|nr:glycosyltransferase family 39 protein [Candidatus Magasanikbacteria bacterium]